MLFQLGGCAFEIWPLNTHETQSQGGAGIVEKPVLGRRPPLEHVGQGPETMELKGRLFPEKFGGSLGELHDMRRAGRSYPLMRGDGSAMGWWAIESVDEHATHLNRHGVGRVIEFSVKLKRSDPDGGPGMFTNLFGLFT